MAVIKQVFLLRHGDMKGAEDGVYYGRTELTLSEKGIAQAKAAAERLKNIDFDGIFTSPLIRCVQTARLLGKKTEITPDAGLNEISFGQWEGVKIEKSMEEEEAFSRWIHDGVEGAPPEGESIEMMHERVVLAFENILSGIQGNARILIVGHHSTLRAIAAYALGLPAAGARSLRCAPGSLGMIELIDSLPVLVRWNA